MLTVNASRTTRSRSASKDMHLLISALSLLLPTWKNSLPASDWQRAARSEAHSSSLGDVGSRSMQLQLEHVSRTFTLQLSETHCPPLQSGRWLSISCCLLDSHAWNRQEEGRGEAGGRVCCAAERHAVTSVPSNLNKIRFQYSKAQYAQ